MRKGVEEAAHKRARVLIVLGRKRPPLGEKAALLEPCASQRIEVARIEIDDSRGRRRRRLEGNEVVPLRIPQQLPTAIASPEFETP
jgi:hypothetical protein